MPDHDTAPDPIDKAYTEAEAVLSDDGARTARRARVLAAVARNTVAPLAASSPSLRRRRRWRRSGWLVAASVAGLGAFLAIQIYPPAPPGPQTAPTTSTAPAPASRAIAASPGPPTPSAAPAPRTVPGALRTVTPAAAASPPDIAPVAAAPPPAVPIAPEPRAFPAAPAAPPPPSPPAAAADQRIAPAPAANYPGPSLSGGAGDEAGDAQARRASSEVFAAPAAVASNRSEASAGLPSDPAARLRAAAGGGRITAVEAMLDQGVPVDAPDADGDTALMKSIQADHPAVAAFLRRHGASLDHENHAGESARDMARAKGDAALDQALGLGP